jgi:hypothetical protein
VGFILRAQLTTRHATGLLMALLNGSSNGPAKRLFIPELVQAP